MIDLGELEIFVRNTLRIQLDDGDVGKGQLIDLYEYLTIGLDIDEELEKTFTMYMWASIISASYEREKDNIESQRRNWQGQLAVELKSTGVRSSDADVKHSYRTDPEWLRLSQEEALYKRYAQIFRSFSIILLKKADALASSMGIRRRADYGDFNIRKGRERREKVKRTIKKRVKRKAV